MVPTQKGLPAKNPSHASGNNGDDSKRDRSARKREPAGNDHGEVDRPGFDLGGSSGKTLAGRGLGLDQDAQEDRKDWSIPRQTGSRPGGKK
jgi:hypothetical protein